VAMRRLVLALGGIVLLLAPRAAHCGGLYGPSALFLHPTAYLPPDRRPTLGMTYFVQTPRGPGREKNSPGEEKHVEWAPVFLEKRLGGRFEGGLVFLYLHGLGKAPRSYGAFAKYQLISEERQRPALAVAVDYLGSGLRSASASVVASKQFHGAPHPIRVHLGYAFTHRSDLQEDPNLLRLGVDSSRVTAGAPFAGLELWLAPTVRLAGEVEKQSSYYVRAPMSVGLTWAPSGKVGIGVGWVNTGRSNRAQFFVGVGYKIGIRR
jgi:hypothetical protein